MDIITTTQSYGIRGCCIHYCWSGSSHCLLMCKPCESLLYLMARTARKSSDFVQDSRAGVKDTMCPTLSMNQNKRTIYVRIAALLKSLKEVLPPTKLFRTRCVRLAFSLQPHVTTCIHQTAPSDHLATEVYKVTKFLRSAEYLACTCEVWVLLQAFNAFVLHHIKQILPPTPHFRTFSDLQSNEFDVS